MDTLTTQGEQTPKSVIPLTKRQYRFVELWLDPNSETFGNAYQSAIAAGFSKKYANIITAESQNNEWLQPAKQRLAELQPEHIYRALQGIALKGGTADRDRIRALELMAKTKGMFIDRSEVSHSVSFTNAVPRPVIDTPDIASIPEADVTSTT